MIKRPPGRPRLAADEDSVPVHLTMTASQYDETCQRAKRDRMTVPERIRRDVAAVQKKNSK